MGLTEAYRIVALSVLLVPDRSSLLYRVDRDQFHHLHTEIVKHAYAHYGYSTPECHSGQYYSIAVNNTLKLGTVLDS